MRSVTVSELKKYEVFSLLILLTKTIGLNRDIAVIVKAYRLQITETS